MIVAFSSFSRSTVMHTGLRRRSLIVGAWLVAVVALFATESAAAQSQVPDGEWHAFGRDGANTKYSPLDQITADNFGDLQIAWRWTSLSQAVVAEHEQIRPSAFMSSPLMANGLVYVSTALGQAAALDAGTGETVWTHDPRIYDYMDRPPNMGWRHRGLTYWKDSESDDARIFMANHDLKLVALNARTGAVYADFGENGYIDLTQGYSREIDASRMTYSSPVAIAGDTGIQATDINLDRQSHAVSCRCAPGTACKAKQNEKSKANGDQIRQIRIPCSSLRCTGTGQSTTSGRSCP